MWYAFANVPFYVIGLLFHVISVACTGTVMCVLCCTYPAGNFVRWQLVLFRFLLTICCCGFLLSNISPMITACLKINNDALDGFCLILFEFCWLRGMQAVKLSTNEILQFLTGGAS